MKALRSFAVRASLPDELQSLVTLAMNLRWSWNPHAVDVFRWVDPDKWDEAGHDPVRMLGLVTPARLAQLAGDGPFTSFLRSVLEDHERYLNEPRWFQKQHPEALQTVAYFSPEFGVSEALPVYSGGLGVLAGDHLKAASDLGVPLVGIGLLYREGYFRQELNADGWQQERYPALDPHGMPLTLLSGADGSALKIEVDLAGARCVAQVWQAMIGRIPLLLLDCDVEENDPEERTVTDRLYGGGGGSEHRLRQEIVLGIGGVRALAAAGYSPDVYHSNEGHAGFLTIERMRTLIASEGLTFEQAIEAVRTSTVFTTHTPVPAGIDVFEGELFERYFATLSKELDVPLAELMALGQTVPSVPGVYNMAISGLRLAGRSNGVSKLHGAVSRSMFADLWPHVPVDDVPITSITNGVHRPTWVGSEIAELLDRYLAPGWAESAEGDWSRIQEAPDSELWRARERARERFVFLVRERLSRQLRARGMSEADLAWTSDALDPSILTVGFARRFAMYKRGTLLLSDVERLRGLLHSSDRPVQFVFAGKSHPLDDGGKEMIRILVHFASDPEHRTRFVFLEDYDMEIARTMVQGVDIWLNNPRRPLEASGTSGMKAALNGALNCSILDGWWDECYDRTNGWAIGTRDVSTDPEYQDKVDASALFDLLERDIAPRFYDRSEGPIPRRWIERVRSSIAGLGPFVGAQRMVRDYTEKFYVPAAAHGARMAAGSHARIKELASWKNRIRNAWDQVAVIDVEGDVLAADVGEERSVRATVRIGALDTDDVSVQLAHGRVGGTGALLDPEIVPMTATECTNGTCNYNATFVAGTAGLYGFAVRVIPTHPDLVTDMDLGLVVWA